MKPGLLTFTLLLFASTLIFAQSDEFKTYKDISYKEGDTYTNERCLLDIRTPEKEGAFPVVIWFHGGGLTGGNKYFPGELLKEEMVMVAVNYRLSPKVMVTDCIDDAAAAVAWVFKNIEDYGGDPEEIIVSGHSAGGYLTLMVGMDKKYLAKYDVDANEIKALFSFSGQTITHFTVRKERGIPGTQPIIDDMAPLFHVRADAPPLYLMTGDRELEILGRYEENAYMYRMMKVVGHKETYLFEFDGHGHGPMVGPGCHVMLEYIRNIEQ